MSGHGSCIDGGVGGVVVMSPSFADWKRTPSVVFHHGSSSGGCQPSLGFQPFGLPYSVGMRCAATAHVPYCLRQIVPVGQSESCAQSTSLGRSTSHGRQTAQIWPKKSLHVVSKPWNRPPSRKHMTCVVSLHGQPALQHAPVW